MNPDVGRDLPLLGQLDHVNWRRVSAFLARPAFQRRFQFPDRRLARTPDRIERDARAGLAAVAFNFEPAVSAIETLPDGRRRLRWPAIAFHLDRPCFRFGAVGSTDGFRGLFPRALRANLRAPYPGTEYHLSRFRAHGGDYSDLCEPQQCHYSLRTGASAEPYRFDEMSNLYSITTNQAAIAALFRVMNRYVGNLPPPPRTGGPPVTNIRNTSSPHWRGWLKPESRCLVPANSFAEYAPEPNPQTKKKDVV
jgi:hypothetical protein